MTNQPSNQPKTTTEAYAYVRFLAVKLANADHGDTHWGPDPMDFQFDAADVEDHVSEYTWELAVEHFLGSQAALVNALNRAITPQQRGTVTRDNIRITPWVPFNQLVNYCTILQGPDETTLNKVESIVLPEAQYWRRPIWIWEN